MGKTRGKFGDYIFIKTYEHTVRSSKVFQVFKYQQNNCYTV